ncbi:hypothetical protein [Frankia sp. QA3]|uniref:hypothetical protein n=1 Tax=Frankia sp. QA3 TaxID=710111 RepID=UPI0018DED848|nr:hypothetical protein [Frankia sp. QA3]
MAGVHRGAAAAAGRHSDSAAGRGVTEPGGTGLVAPHGAGAGKGGFAAVESGATGPIPAGRGAVGSGGPGPRATAEHVPGRDPLGLRGVRRAGAITVGMAVLLGLLVWLYGTSVTSLRPRDLPILTVGPAPAATALADQISRVEPGALTVRTVPTVAAADRALRDRDAYAAIVIGDDGLTLRVASAASPAVTEAITRGIRVFMPGLEIPVVDVVANASRDQAGGGLAAGYLPLVLVIAAAGVLLTRLIRSRAVRLAGIAALAVLCGFAGTVALQGALDVLPGSFLATMAVLTLLALAVAGPVVGVGAVAGTPGLVGIVLVTVVGAALSAAESAPEMLPRPWGDIGQFAPPGAGVTLLRSTNYFDGAAGGRPVVVLAVWLIVGLWLAFVGERGAAPALYPGNRGAPRPGQAPQRHMAGATAAGSGTGAANPGLGAAVPARAGATAADEAWAPLGPAGPALPGAAADSPPAARAGSRPGGPPAAVAAPLPTWRSPLERTVPIEPSGGVRLVPPTRPGGPPPGHAGGAAAGGSQSR